MPGVQADLGAVAGLLQSTAMKRAGREASHMLLLVEGLAFNV